MVEQDFKYFLDCRGTDILKNGFSIRALITNTNVNASYDDKKITTLDEIKRGDIIEYDNKTFMVISEEVGKRYDKWKGIMRLLPFSITFNSSCTFYSVHAYIETQSFGVQNGQIMTLADGKIFVHVPNNSDSEKIKIGDRFIKSNQAFKISGIDSYSRPGIVTLTCDKDQLDATDDLINEIAGGLACIVEITNTQPIEIYQGSTLQLTWNSNNAPVVFESSDESIAAVDLNGLVTGVSVGQVAITIKNASNAMISDSATVNVIEVPVAYTINITSTSTTPSEIKQGQSKTYNVEVYNDSILISDGSQPVTWQLFADDQVSSTNLALITSQSGSSCTVKNNNSTSGYVQLKATLQSDHSIVAWIRIQMKTLL
jgi:hypothetical protein